MNFKVKKSKSTDDSSQNKENSQSGVHVEKAIEIVIILKELMK
jgi:hypothetical protein